MEAAATLGRPSLRTPDVVEEVLNRLAEGEGLWKICTDSRLPSRGTVLRWAQEHEEFRDQYARAMALGVDSQADDCDMVARTEPDVNRARLIVDTIKWKASKTAPHKYGDRVAHQMLDEHGKPTRAGVTIIIDGAPGE